MNWEAVGAAAELLSSIGVLATLIYIAVQVRDAKRVNLINTSAQMTDNVAGRVIENPRLSEIIARINSQIGHHLPQAKVAMDEWNLSAEDAEIWARYWGTVWRGFQSRFDAGALDERSLSIFLANPQAALYLRGAKRTFNPEFIRMIDSVNPNVFRE
jgi:hypothetical protein